jgi:NAD+ synthase (glutamine-hydrolysing)
MKSLRVALAQINTTVGDLNGNRDKIIENIQKSKSAGCDIVVFPELAITGYPPEDLVLRTGFIDKNIEKLYEIAAQSTGIAVVVGFIEQKNHLYNSSAFIYDGRIYGTYHKIFLPNYGVFDEKRYFCPGTEIPVFDFDGTSIGINICEDIWYPDGPATAQVVAGAGIILNLNASPYQLKKWQVRERMISTRAADNAVYLVYVNSVGGQDELIFEGGSLVYGPGGELITRGKFFEEDLIIVDLIPELAFRTRLHDLRVRERLYRKPENRDVVHYKVPITSSDLNKFKPQVKRDIVPELDICEEVYRTLTLGVRDYVIKNGFSKAVIGISGGIDSALVSAIAVDALGADNVEGIFMPTHYTASISREDSFELAGKLGFKLHEISIENIFKNYVNDLKPLFESADTDVTLQNIQARIRGNILMAYSNKSGALVLTTGNKSELAVGYATLYGDMAGGFAVLKDIPKTMVYKLAEYRNSEKDVIPRRIIEREPTAELKEDQKDTDSLPPYEILDPILKCLIEEDLDVEDVIEKGFDEETVHKVARMIHTNEYKRRQAPPGIKITSRAFGRDRRVPITNKYIEWTC